MYQIEPVILNTISFQNPVKYSLVLFRQRKKRICSSTLNLQNVALLNDIIINWVIIKKKHIKEESMAPSFLQITNKNCICFWKLRLVYTSHWIITFATSEFLIHTPNWNSCHFILPFSVPHSLFERLLFKHGQSYHTVVPQQFIKQIRGTNTERNGR